MSQPLSINDPGYFLLEQGINNPEQRSTTTVYNKDCYICNDREFSLMGLPLCYPCRFCQGHVAADDTICSFCKKDQLEGLDD